MDVGKNQTAGGVSVEREHGGGKRPTPARFGNLPSVEGTRVLIVEDNNDSRATLETILRLFGCDVTTAADGRAGFEAICRERPEVAVVDIGLPGIDGYEIARRVRSTLPGSIRLIAVTGYGSAEDRAAAMKAGFDAHVVKPMDPDELIRLLRE